jgi:chromatin assembly factor 1 subunit A
MEDPPQVIPTALGKRALEDDVDAPVSTPDNAAPSDTSTPLTILSTMASPSPMKAEPSHASDSGSSNGSVTGDVPTWPLGAATSNGTQPPAKKRKLTIREKEEKKLEKDTKEKAKAEKKAQKDQEDKLKAEQRAQKDEERRIKDEERRKKNEEKEEKKKAKEFELQRKEEEKLKKERVCYLSTLEFAVTNLKLVATKAQCLFRQAKI